MAILTDFCVYTIVSRDRLDPVARDGKPLVARTTRIWRDAHTLRKEAVASRKDLPILLGDAKDCSQLLYWGVLQKIELGANHTKYTVDRLRRLPRPHKPQELVLRSTGKHIAPGFIRPYALCHTPQFLAKAALRTAAWSPKLPPAYEAVVLRFIAAAIRHAADTAPRRWGLTPYPNGGIRLNVGWCEVITASEDEIALLVTRDAAPGGAGGHRLHFEQKRGRSYFYQRAPGSARVAIPLDGSLPVGRILKALEPALFENVTVSARAGLGWGVGEGHSDAAVSAIATRIGESIPTPGRRTSTAQTSNRIGRPRPGSPEFFEATARRAAIVRLERSKVARRLCISRHGCRCSVCGFDFKATYGNPGTGFIIVHHLYPLADARGRRRVDPYEDLRPVCANCHYMIHTEDPPVTIEELRRVLPRRRR
jgi:hypothetical protein